MATKYENPAYPHKIKITRIPVTGVPAVKGLPVVVWEGDGDCQVGANGQTESREGVFVSDHAIYTRCIDADLATGDCVEVTYKKDATPVAMTLEQFSTDLIWTEDDIPYGTTLWVNRIRQ